MVGPVGSLGMTKLSVGFPVRLCEVDGKIAPPLLSSRPERTRISCYAALDKAACGPFRKEGPMKFDNATKFHRKSGGAQWRDLRFSLPVLTRTLQPDLVCSMVTGLKPGPTSRALIQSRTLGLSKMSVGFRGSTLAENPRLAVSSP